MLCISLVSYLNTKPFLEGLNEEFGSEELSLNLLPPADCAAALAEEKCDLALIPVGSMVDFEELEVLKDYCIGADGPVDSVFMFSQVPLDEIEVLRLDPHSRSSNGLTRILFKKRGQKISCLQPTERDFEAISGTTAGVAIGDAAYAIRGKYAYVYDLASEWKRLTGLPFVFAVWAARKGAVSEELKARLSRAFARGMGAKERCAEKYGQQYGYTHEEALNYLSHSISFNFDREKHEALRLYFQELINLEPLMTAFTQD